MLVKIYVVMHGWSCDIMSEVYPQAYFSTRDKAETFILKSGLLDREEEGNGIETYVEEIVLDEKAR